MTDNVDIIRHDRVTQHASTQRKRFKPYRSTVGAVLFDAKASYFRAHVSPTSLSCRHESYAATLNRLEIQLDVVVPNVYLGGPSDT